MMAGGAGRSPGRALWEEKRMKAVQSMLFP